MTMSLIFTEPEAFYALLRMAADIGDLPTEEESTHYWSSRLMSLKHFVDMDIFEAAAITDRVQSILATTPQDELLAAISAALSPQLRETAFVHAVDVLLADGVMEPNERATLETIERAFGLPPELSSKAIEVMLLKNRY